MWAQVASHFVDELHDRMYDGRLIVEASTRLLCTRPLFAAAIEGAGELDASRADEILNEAFGC